MEIRYTHTYTHPYIYIHAFYLNIFEPVSSVLVVVQFCGFIEFYIGMYIHTIHTYIIIFATKVYTKKNLHTSKKKVKIKKI